MIRAGKLVCSCTSCDAAHADDEGLKQPLLQQSEQSVAGRAKGQQLILHLPFDLWTFLLSILMRSAGAVTMLRCMSFLMIVLTSPLPCSSRHAPVGTSSGLPLVLPPRSAASVSCSGQACLHRSLPPRVGTFPKFYLY